MKKYIPQFLFIGLFPISILLIFLAKSFPESFTTFYTEYVNKWFIEKLSQLTGLIPFSLFEWLIYSLILISVSYVVFTLYCLFTRPKIWMTISLNFLLNMMSGASILYFIFIIFWGLNYYKIPLEQSFHLTVQNRSVDELASLYEKLIVHTNETRNLVLENEEGVFTTGESIHDLFTRTVLGYQEASRTYPLLDGEYGLPKPVLLSSLMSYTNITGIYSPFTAEANVNVSVPETTLLFTTMHEMAHQRGFASENEANFIAYLTCIHHPDVDFQYSGYLNALSYVNRALAKVDRTRLTQLNEQLSEGVRRDLTYQSNYWKQYEGNVEKTFTQMNQTYLKLNGVSDGVQSYGRVVDLLLAYEETNSVE